jgi:hypothetical protein
VNFYNDASKVVIDQNAVILQANWALVSGNDKVGIRDDLIAVGGVIITLLEALETAISALTLTPERATGNTILSNISDVHRDAIFNALTAADALITSTSDV